MFPDKVNVLGTDYSIVVKKYDEEPAFERSSIDGYVEQGTHIIAIGDLHTFPGWENESDDFIESCMKHTLRHECVHAAFNESGLQDSCSRYDGPWSKNEAMVDYWAIQGPKIYKIWQQANAL